MCKIRLPAVINISIYKTTIKKSSHILSISFCRCKQFNISIQQYSCLAFYRLNKFQFLTTHYTCTFVYAYNWLLDWGFPAAGFGWILVEQRHNQISTLNQRWFNFVCLLVWKGKAAKIIVIKKVCKCWFFTSHVAICTL